MWRRYGDSFFALLVLGIFAIEAGGLALLTCVFIGRIFGLLAYGRLLGVLTATVVVTALSLVVLSAHVIAYHAWSARREKVRRAEVASWTAQLVHHLYSGQPFDQAELPVIATEALVDLRERLKGPDAARLTELAIRLGVPDRLIKQLGSRRLPPRLEALEALAKGRFPTAVAPCLALLRDEKPVIRWMAARALARTVAAMPPSEHRDREADRITEALILADLPSGVVEETFVLLEHAAPRGLDHVLASPTATRRLKRAAIDAAGLLGIATLAERIGPYLVDGDPELRAAALRFLARLPKANVRLEDVVLLATQDPVEYVRVQAVRGLGRFAAGEVVDVLGDRLGDSSWSVRRAAAETLGTVGEGGLDALRRAAVVHPDRYARQMAQVTVAEIETGARS